jgi:hypothetical protein
MLFYFEISNLNMLCCLYCWLMKFFGVLDYLCFRYPRVWIWSWIITQTDFRVGFRFRFGLWIVGLVPWHYILSEFNPLPSSNSHDMTHNKFLLFIFHIFFFRFASCFSHSMSVLDHAWPADQLKGVMSLQCGRWRKQDATKWLTYPTPKKVLLN